ncbi:MAG: hypothetical protein AB8G17_14820 [Gammaproteobacteria bacterium]
MKQCNTQSPAVSGRFMTLDDERYYLIENVDQMPPFFISLVSDDDHWLFVASNGGLTAGRVSPETALFPYVTVDQVYDSTPHTGCRTIVRRKTATQMQLWEPFNSAHDGLYAVRRNLYKNTLGDKILFEEINDDLELAFRYSWRTSDLFGFVREAQLHNTSSESCEVEVLDGLQNLLPAGTPRATQAAGSNLVDAYKWNELDPATGVALYTLFSGITDRAEPAESLRANTVFSYGLDDPAILLSNRQLDAFRAGETVQTETHNRGIRGAYFVVDTLTLAADGRHAWYQVANVEQSQADVVQLREAFDNPGDLQWSVDESIERGSDALARLMAAADGFQETAEENVSVHHYANVLFNVMRGGLFNDQYTIQTADFSRHVAKFNAALATRCAGFLEQLPESQSVTDLLAQVGEHNDAQLQRLALEFLPITFGRRHGDPSRPWNQFAIRLKDARGQRLLSYQGNWRDIFQNWEALLLSYPAFTEQIIAKFVNASTVDGYNPYRITDDGIDWEVEEPDDPWSYIGYWGDHQIIYLQKFLELSTAFHPQKLADWLRAPLFSYANVPYRLRPYDALVEDAKNTVDYDHDLASRIEQRVERLGADGKLLLTADGEVYQVNLFEKLLVPLLCKLGNLVVDGGIWLNAQRPEWNDANNALVGQGLSMVTLYYLPRYVRTLQGLLEGESDSIEVSSEVVTWHNRTAKVLRGLASQIADGPVDDARRAAGLDGLGRAASDYRAALYQNEAFSGRESLGIDAARQMLDDAQIILQHSMQSNRRPDGLYHAYNLLELDADGAHVETLYPMLEGQVAALSAGLLDSTAVIGVLDALFDSGLYRYDQKSFLLYPDRELPSFLEKNCVPESQAQAIDLVRTLLDAGDRRLIQKDRGGTYRFHADLHNVGALNARLDALRDEYGAAVDDDRAALCDVYEQVFHHKAFTGRSGGMFGFEGLGSIYWHMVSKLLLAVQENFFVADERGDPLAARLAEYYYRVREGIGFNKTPAQYGAFVTDPYSHTPGHAGAQQPGMTGQVKEEVLTRFGELGVRVSGGAARFRPSLLRAREFVTTARAFRYLDVAGEWQELSLPIDALVFTWCQVPVVYQLVDAGAGGMSVTLDDGSVETFDQLELPANLTESWFERSGRIQRVDISLTRDQLLTSGD